MRWNNTAVFLDVAEDGRASGLNKETGGIAQQWVLGVVQPTVVGNLQKVLSIVLPDLY